MYEPTVAPHAVRRPTHISGDLTLPAHQVASLLTRAIEYRAQHELTKAWGLVELVLHRAAAMVKRQDRVLDHHDELPGLTALLPDGDTGQQNGGGGQG